MGDNGTQMWDMGMWHRDTEWTRCREGVQMGHRDVAQRTEMPHRDRAQVKDRDTAWRWHRRGTRTEQGCGTGR